jgi:hypothetical protein
MSDMKKICIGTLALSTIVCTAFYVIALPTPKQPTRLSESPSTYDSTSIIVNPPIKSDNSQVQIGSLLPESYTYIRNAKIMVDESKKIATCIENTHDYNMAMPSLIMCATARNILESKCPQQIAEFGQVANTFAMHTDHCSRVTFDQNNAATKQNIDLLIEQSKNVEKRINEIKKAHGEE